MLTASSPIPSLIDAGHGHLLLILRGPRFSSDILPRHRILNGHLSAKSVQKPSRTLLHDRLSIRPPAERYLDLALVTVHAQLRLTIAIASTLPHIGSEVYQSAVMGAYTPYR